MRELAAHFESRESPPEARRDAERGVRRRAVAWKRTYPGLSCLEAAESLRLSPRTLCEWEGAWRAHGLSIGPRGRPRKTTTPKDRAHLLGLLWVLGPRTGWETLREYLPDVGRRELRRLLFRARRMWRRLDRVGALALTWKRPGTVWAMDFTDPPTPIEGTYPKILLVRDLASGATLLALPCLDETARSAVDGLRSLFLEHGAPLVLKADNGSAFIAEAMRELCGSFGVTLLYSPPHYPAYNGACEAGVGSIKTRVHHLAARAGRPGEWTLDDVEGARLLANETGRPRGLGRPPPGDEWNGRQAIGDLERDLFRRDVARHLDAERARRGLTSECALDPIERASCERAAIARALCEHGVLEFKTRRVSLPISAFLSAIIS